MTEPTAAQERAKLVKYIRNISDTFHPKHDRVIERIARQIEGRDDDNYVFGDHHGESK